MDGIGTGRSALSPAKDEAWAANSGVERAWARCLLAGLQPGDPVQFEPVARAALGGLEERHRGLLAFAHPHLQLLSHAVTDAGCVILLINQEGTILRRYGRTDLVAPDLAVVTRIGINLDERCVGATAPSVALAEHRPSVVFGGSHFCGSLRNFFCVAVPIEDWRGESLGVVNVTTYGSAPRFDAMALAVDSVRCIENDTYRPGNDLWRFDFHIVPSWVGSPSGGVVLVDSEGAIVGANRQSVGLLAAEPTELRGRRFCEVFDVDLHRLFDQSLGRTAGLSHWRTANGLQVFGRIDAGGNGPEAQAVSDAALQSPKPPPAAAPAAEPPSVQRLRDVEARAIELALERSGGNVSAAAGLLGISRQTLHRRLRRV